nr:MAG TPA: hypothetical protein [Caudoviricetes sp.]
MSFLYCKNHIEVTTLCDFRNTMNRILELLLRTQQK